jgi:hypothetical protein
MPFAIDCVRADVKQVAHFGVLCGHYDKGNLLMPYAAHWTAPETVIALANMNVNIGGHSVPIKAGHRYDFPYVDAIHLIRGGYARVVGNSHASDAEQKTDHAGAQPGKPAKAKRQRVGADSPR